MNEEQEKPKKWYKRWRLYLLILVTLVIVVLIYILSRGEVEFYPTPGFVYNTAREELQTVVNDYQNRNNGVLPTINGSVTINGTDYKIINICPLLTQDEESLKNVVESLWCGNTSNDDNWDSGCAECLSFSSYIWTVDNEGNVYSSCVGEYCNASGVDGYQGVWP